MTEPSEPNPLENIWHFPIQVTFEADTVRIESELSPADISYADAYSLAPSNRRASELIHGVRRAASWLILRYPLHGPLTSSEMVEYLGDQGFLSSDTATCNTYVARQGLVVWWRHSLTYYGHRLIEIAGTGSTYYPEPNLAFAASPRWDVAVGGEAVPPPQLA
jgi:hypothetical protein